MATYSKDYDSPAPTADLFTYQDALEHLESHTLGGAMDSERRDFRSAFLGAYSDLASRYDWLYYHTEHEIRLEAAYSTGTITYDNSTKQVTIYDVDDVDGTTATWPTNATDGRIKINDVRYPVASRVSNTIIKLPDDINPGVDISTVTPYTINETKVAAVASKGTTSYTWLRSSYTLPGDFKDMDPPHTEISVPYHLIASWPLSAMSGLHRILLAGMPLGPTQTSMARWRCMYSTNPAPPKG